MSQIRITPEELREGSDQIKALSEAIADNLTTLKSIVDGVANNWEGAAQSSYVSSFEDIHKQFVESFPPTVEGLAEQMKAVADTLEETDAEIAKAFSGQ